MWLGLSVGYPPVPSTIVGGSSCESEDQLEHGTAYSQLRPTKGDSNHPLEWAWRAHLLRLLSSFCLHSTELPKSTVEFRLDCLPSHPDFRTVINDHGLVDLENNPWDEGTCADVTITLVAECLEGDQCIAEGQREHLGGSVLADESFSADRTAFRRQLAKQFGQEPGRHSAGRRG